MTFKDEIYSALPETAKPANAISATLQTILFIILALLVMGGIAAFIGIVIYIIGNPDLMQSIADGNEPTPEEILPALGFAIPAYAIAGFGGLILMAIWKTKTFEKRSLASIGLDRFLYGSKFWLWFALGMVFAIILTAWTSMHGAVALSEEVVGEPDWSIVANAGVAISIIILLLVLMVQAPAEEIFFRGWLLSAVSARNGFFVAVIVSSLLFMLAHYDFGIAGPGITLYTLGAVGSVGILLAAIAVSTKTVVTAAGFHTGYNFLLLSAGILTSMATTGETDFVQLVLAQFDRANLPPMEMNAGFWTDLGVRMAITLIPAVILFSRKGANTAV